MYWMCRKKLCIDTKDTICFSLLETPLTSFSTRGHQKADFSNSKMSHCALKMPAKGLQVEYSHWGHNVLSLHTTELLYVRAAEALSRLLSAGRTRKGMFPIPLLLWNTVTHFPCPSPLPLISYWYDNILHVLHACIWNTEQCRCVWTKVQEVSLC